MVCLSRMSEASKIGVVLFRLKDSRDCWASESAELLSRAPLLHERLSFWWQGNVIGIVDNGCINNSQLHNGPRKIQIFFMCFLSDSRNRVGKSSEKAEICQNMCFKNPAPPFLEVFPTQSSCTAFRRCYLTLVSICVVLWIVCVFKKSKSFSSL